MTPPPLGGAVQPRRTARPSAALESCVESLTAMSTAGAGNFGRLHLRARRINYFRLASITSIT